MSGNRASPFAARPRSASASREKSAPEVSVISEPTVETPPTSFSWYPWGQAVTELDVVNFTSQLALMCRSGVDIAEALRSISRRARKPSLRLVLTSVTDDVFNGDTLAASLRKHPAVFTESYIASVIAGETTGTLIDVFDRLSQTLRAEMKIRSAVQSAIIYPIALLGIASLVVAALLLFVLPQFQQIFVDLERSVPPLTACLFGVSSFVREQWWLILLAGVGGGFAFYRLREAPFVRRYFDWFVLEMPVVSPALRLLFAGRSFRLLGVGSPGTELEFAL